MAIFLDTGFFFALKFKKEPNYNNAIKILERIAKKEFGTQFSSTFIIDELMTLIWRRTKNSKIINETWDFFRPKTKVCHILDITLDDIYQIYNLFNQQINRPKFLSFTDCSTLYLMDKYNIIYLASFDSNFNGLVNRIH